MRPFSTRVCGVFDYVVGAALIAAPWLFGFARNGPDTWLPIVIGVVIIGQSLFTNYEYGVVRRIPMRTHLSIDFVAGLILAVSPWLFGYADYVFIPHLVVGLAIVAMSLLTRPVPGPATARRYTPDSELP